MDDYLDSIDTVSRAKTSIHNMIKIHRRGGSEIRNWTCSNREVLESIPPHLRSIDDHEIRSSIDLSVERILGMTWDPNSDNFMFRIEFAKCDPKLLTGE